MYLNRCLLYCLLLGVGLATLATAQTGYHDHAAIGDALRSHAQAHPDLLRVGTLATSRQGREVWLAALGGGGADPRPAVLIVAGLEGNQLFGTECALAFIAHALEAYGQDDAVTTALDSTTFYVIPRLNPDAAAYFFAEEKRAQVGNLAPADDDHDGLVEEDGPDDLNGDGMIAWMRIEDPEGTYRKATRDDRLLREAKAEKGEAGGWRYLVEGRDNDGDKVINEDWPGGVDFNRNFPFNYAYFAPLSGIHQVCEAETRALADFIVAHPSIGIVFTYSASENLLKTPKSAEGGSGRSRNLEDVHKDDLPYYQELGKAFRKAIDIDKELGDARVPGAFSDWMYFHRGRLSLATPGWSPAIQLAINAKGKKPEKEEAAAQPAEESAKKDAPGEESAEQKDEKPKEEEDGEAVKEEAEFLTWLEENQYDGFLPWRSLEHPDFPGQLCEVGGFAPFAKTVPPAPVRDALLDKQAGFLVSLAERLPRIAISKAEAKPLGSGVYDLEIEVRNSGYLPTVLAHGVATGEVLPTRVTLDIEDENVLAGRRVTKLGAVRGSGGVETLRYTIRKPDARDGLRISVTSALAGVAETTIPLSEN